MKMLIKKYGHIWLLSYAFIYLTWFSYLEHHITKKFYVVHSALDHLIPFNEYFIIPYFLWFLYVAGTITYFFFTSKPDYYKLCIFLFTGMTLSLLICTIFPNGTDFRPIIDPDKNLCSKLVFYLYQADTNTNVFPSIHVFNSIVTNCVIFKSALFKNRSGIKLLSKFLMLSICASTVILKQHSVIDVLGAVIMYYSIYPFIYTNTSYASSKAQKKDAAHQSI